MRKGLFCSVAAIAITTALSGPVAAADQRPFLKAAPSAPGCMWCGFYLGGHLGYGWAKANGTVSEDTTSDTDLFRAADVKARGLAIGVHAGYNWQVGQWVYGLEGDGTYTNWENSEPFGTGSGLGAFKRNLDLRVDWLASIRGRLGFAFDRTLIYATGGVGFAGGRSTWNPVGSPKDAESLPLFYDGKWAPVVGGGIEWKYSPNFSLRLEGLHYFFDKTRDLRFGTSTITTIHQKMGGISVIRAGASWYFDSDGGGGWGKGPVATRY